MFTEALSALAINSSDVSLKDYQEIIAKQPIYKIEKPKNIYINISDYKKVKINNELLMFIEINKQFLPIHREVLIKNFDSWEIENGSMVLSIIEETIHSKNELNKKYLELKKLLKKYSSLTSKVDELIELHNEMITFTKAYLKRAKEANEASKFIKIFLSDNKEVLKALA